MSRGPGGRAATFEFEGCTLAYTEHGNGNRALILIHGQVLSRSMHEPLAASLAGQGHRVITMDLLGHGESDRPRELWRYSMTQFAEQVVGLMDHLGIRRAVVGGTSLGANVWSLVRSRRTVPEACWWRCRSSSRGSTGR